MPKHILLVDDDGGVRLLLGRVLEVEGYEVGYARTGREAVARFLAGPPALVLLDLNLPGKDGWAAFEVMRSTYPLIPAIVITARPHQYERAVKLGIDALMEKPLELPLLLETIRNLLAESESQRVSRISRSDFKTARLVGPAESLSLQNTT